MADKNSPEEWPLVVIRSRRRKKTISGEIKDGQLVIRAPANLSQAELQPHIDSLRKKLSRKAKRHRAPRSDDDLERMAGELNREYFEGRLRWRSIRFVGNQRKRFGSCTPATGDIRLSDRLRPMPLWVLRYVLVHELAHLVEANHGPAFWALVNRYPLTERARGYLMAAGLEELSDKA
jgi:predicted metal-dependent hydrolase